MLFEKYKEDMKNLSDMIAASPSATKVELTLDHPGQTIVLRDLLQLFKVFNHLKEPDGDTAILAITVTKLKVVNLNDLEAIKASEWIKQGVIKGLSEESGCEIKLDFSHGKAFVRVQKNEIPSMMQVTIQGESSQGHQVYLELF